MRIKLILTMTIVFSLAFLSLTNEADALTAKEIDNGVKTALEKLKDIEGGNNVLRKAAGLLVFPSVLKIGIGLGGEYGEGALLIRRKTVGYYSTAAASIGLQLGAQQKTIIIAFMDKAALKEFRDSDGWKAGVDASIAVVAVGAGGAIDTANTNKPIVAFVFDQKGLMYNLTLEGAKISRIKR